MSNHYAVSLAVLPNGGLLAGTGNGVYKSDDRGEHWQHLRFVDTLIKEICITHRGTYLVGLEHQLGSFPVNMLRSEDGGKTWQVSDSGLVSEGGVDDRPKTMAIDSKGRIYVGGSWGIYYSDDDGKIWHHVYNYKGGENLGSVMGITIDHKDVVYAVTDVGGIYRAKDGLVWKNVYSVSGGMDFTDIAVAPNGKLYAVAKGTLSDFLCYVSEDGGESWGGWMARLSGYPALGEVRVTPNGDVYIAAEWEYGVFRSRDEGRTWEDVSSGLLHKDVQALAWDSQGYLYAATEGGGVHRSRERVLVSVTEQGAEVGLQLRSTPNPGSEVVRVEYSVARGGRVRLLVCDVQGRTVATVLDGVVEAGSHAVPYSTKVLSSGVYLLRLESGGEVLTRQISVVK